MGGVPFHGILKCLYLKWDKAKAVFEVSQTRAPGAAGLVSAGSLSLAERRAKLPLINSQFEASRDSVVEIAQGKKLTQNLKKKKKIRKPESE